MKNASVFVKIGVGFLAFYIAYTAIFFVYFVNDAFKKNYSTQIGTMEDYGEIGRILIKSGKTLTLNDRLGNAIEHKTLDLYLIRKNGEDLYYGNRAGANELIQFPPVGSDQGSYAKKVGDDIKYQLYLFREGPYELILGHKTSVWTYIDKIWEDQKSFILKDLAFVVLSVVCIVLYAFRDLRRLLSNLSRQGANRTDEKAHSKEMLTLIKGLKGFESGIEELEAQNRVMNNQVLAALKNELFSGKAPPYDFNCTLVRTDINHFTQTFSSPHRAVFMETINEFFIGVTHIVSRYGGFIHEFVGDEVLFYFKDDDHPNTRAVALAALRDINRLADSVHQKTSVEKEFPFRVKSSLAWGTLRFGPLVNGFSLAGNPFIETVRMLSHVTERSENTVVFDDEFQKKLGLSCRTEDYGTVLLKGYTEPRKLVRYVEHAQLKQILKDKMNVTARENLSLYRHDDDIADLLRYIKQEWRELPSDRAVQLIGNFKKFRVTVASETVVNAYLELVTDVQAEMLSQKRDFVLSSIISISVFLFRKEDLQGELKAALLSCLINPNRRVVANGVDVFAALDPSCKDEMFEKLLQNSDNRILANVLAKEGKHQWDRAIHKRVSGMLNSGDPLFRASGLYALGEIAQHIRANDSVAFNADSKLQDLLTKAKTLTKDTNIMVARQAKIVGEKVQPPAQTLKLARRVA